jgi:uncharacterized protein (DUF952 family)
VIYKLVTDEEWAAARENGVYEGSAVDRQDGFVHFSAAEQVAETAARHFAGQSGLVLLSVAEDELDGELRWEESRGGALFPHLYGTMPVGAVRRADPLPAGLPADAAVSQILG